MSRYTCACARGGLGDAVGGTGRAPIDLQRLARRGLRSTFLDRVIAMQGIPLGLHAVLAPQLAMPFPLEGTPFSRPAVGGGGTLTIRF